MIGHFLYQTIEWTLAHGQGLTLLTCPNTRLSGCGRGLGVVVKVTLSLDGCKWRQLCRTQAEKIHRSSRTSSSEMVGSVPFLITWTSPDGKGRPFAFNNSELLKVMAAKECASFYTKE